MRIVFMGTPEIALGCLQKIIDEKHEVIGVITQPDKPQNRGKKLGMPPVKELALKYDIPVYQPLKARDEEFVNVLKELNPDVIVVVAYGQILPKSILDIPKFGCINVHVSLLPKYRGAAPINWVIINGEEKTGVTTMYMDEGLDTGDMILQKEFALDNEITAGELHDKMMVVGAETLKETLDLIEKGCAPRTKQNHDEFSYAPMMDKSLGNIDFNKSAKDIHNLVRGVNPWPSAYTTYDGKTMKVWKTKVLNEESQKAPGTILSVDKDGIKVSTLDKVILLEEIQMPGKKRVLVSEYIKGNSIDTSKILG
ncbi:MULTISPECIES: methionyl-tRNA formyltransferase [Romboutsia]|uniref:methionyl-tRNA formyltransferase n=1 Tax=Romboutsia TaxID=1501226 RepID=UPI0018999BC1|nr:MULTISPECIES: methionyl-tRNA formyltransferase [Romboutsia]MCH1961012.1 methionyl-tRNA formyltransferase [Romboutsia hominis]MCH1968555.1 methionyl-tRNA formyltransferase [Romboutsia hominis]MDB8804572.1 methionyl-tRNA formyltransferase [Romboutsia sp. 1001216sp1]MDB8806504.1 methionyl-tRNA formyltransferase [Romboutsia sp. 1001216sp1]MDB8810220.1 methionyl-tRNA formyltransferase [Romboutsia sp. 1001216sp1]